MEQTKKKGIDVLPYVQAVAEIIERSLVAYNVRTAFWPHQTLASVFWKSKDRTLKERVPGIAYKVKCKDCNFIYIRESKRSWSSRSAEHIPARAASKESAIRLHAEATTCNVYPRYAPILETNKHSLTTRLYLESFLSFYHRYKL